MRRLFALSLLPLIALSGALTLSSKVAIAAPPSAAPAQTKEEKEKEEQAREAIRRGFAAFARGEASVALEEYKRAQALVPEANLPYRYAAEALVQLGRTEEAIASLEKYLSLKPDVSDAAATRTKIDQLRASLPSTVTLECSLSAKVAVQVDSAPAQSFSCPAEVKVRGGDHVFVLRAPGKRDVTLKMTTTPGGAVKLPVVFEDGPPPAASSSSSSSEPKSGFPLRTLAYVAFGLSAASLATALIVDAGMLGGAIDDFRASVDTGSPDAAEERSKVQTLRTVAIVSYAGAAAFALTGGILFLVSPSTSVRATALPTGGGHISTTIRF